MRLLVLSCVVFLMGAWFGFHEARAAGGLQYDGFLFNKNVSKKSADFLNGYAAGAYDMVSVTAQIANEAAKYFTPQVFTKQYQCLQKFQTANEIVAWAKAYWSKEPDSWAAESIFGHACEYDASARSNTMTKSSGPTRSPAQQHTISIK
jgi:hypothetical protein